MSLVPYSSVSVKKKQENEGRGTWFGFPALEAVIEYFSEYNMDHRVMVLGNSTATVEEAAQQHGVDPDQIGKPCRSK